MPPQQDTPAPKAAAASGADSAGSQTDAGPVLTMAPHSQSARYWISGQANSIFQAHGHFHSPYQGANSLIDDFEAKASEVGTLYLGYQLRPNTRFNTDLIVDVENAAIPISAPNRILRAVKFTRSSA